MGCAGSNLRVVQIRNHGARRIFVLREMAWVQAERW